MRHRRDRLGPLEPVLKSDRYQGAINVGNSPGTTPPPVFTGDVVSLQNADLVNGICVATNDTHAYVLSSSGRMVAVDISDSTNPTWVSTLTDTRFAGSPTDIVVDGSYAYTVGGAAGSRIFCVVDISNPAAMSIVGTWANNGVYAISNGTRYLSPKYGNYISFRTSNDLNMAGSSSRVAFIDVSVPASPTFAYSVSVGGAPHEQVFIGDRMILGVTGQGGGADTIKVYDISNLASPAQTFSGLGWAMTGNHDQALRRSTGNVFHVQYNGTNSILRLIDVTNVDAPTNPLSTTALTNAIIQLDVRGNGVFIPQAATTQLRDPSTLDVLSTATNSPVANTTDLSVTPTTKVLVTLVGSVTGRLNLFPIAGGL